MHYFVVRKKDVLPAYQLASVVDDLHFGVDLAVRGAGQWPSAPAQLCLATLLRQPRFGEASFCHHPLLKDANALKLSKSAGAPSARHLRRQGGKLSDLQELIAQVHRMEEWTGACSWSPGCRLSMLPCDRLPAIAFGPVVQPSIEPLNTLFWDSIGNIRNYKLLCNAKRF